MSESERERAALPGFKDIARSIQRLVETTSDGLAAKLDEHMREVQGSHAEEADITLPETDAESGSPLDEALKLVYRLSTAPYTIGRVIETFDYETAPGRTIPMVRLVSGNRILEVHLPVNMELRSGSTVRLNATTSQIVGYAEECAAGTMATVREISLASVLVEVAGSNRNVQKGSAKDLVRGDRVILDETQTLIIHVLPRASEQFKLKQEPKHTFDDVVGHDDAKALLRYVVDTDPATDKYARHYGRPREKGLFLFGPPGCGKTMIGEAVASAIREKYGMKALDSGYFYIVVPELLDKFVGETERALRSCFEAADLHFHTHGFPAVLVLDEGEALFSRRGSGKSSDMEKTVVPQLLGLLNNTTALVIIMTNRPDVIDPAVIRDGRFGRQIFIGRPTRIAAETIIRKNFAKYPIDTNSSSIDVLVRIATEGFYDPARRLIDDPLRLADGSDVYFTLAHIVNGAMLERLVNDAATIAEARDRASGSLSGINAQDVLGALEVIYADKKRLDHADELDEFFTQWKDKLPKTESQRAITA